MGSCLTTKQIKENPMKTIFRLVYLITLFFVGVAFQSCEEADELSSPGAPVTVKFPTVNLGLSELAGATQITIPLSRPAATNGNITINAYWENENDFTSQPAVEDGKIILPVTVGQSQVTFILTPVDNNLHTGNRNLHFTISSVTDGFIIGTEKSLHITIYENDQPNPVNFVASQVSVQEQFAEGMTVAIGFSLQAVDDGIVELELLNAAALYGTHFTTEPEAINGKITLPVTAGTSFLPVKF